MLHISLIYIKRQQGLKICIVYHNVTKLIESTITQPQPQHLNPKTTTTTIIQLHNQSWTLLLTIDYWKPDKATFVENLTEGHGH